MRLVQGPRLPVTCLRPILSVILLNASPASALNPSASRLGLALALLLSGGGGMWRLASGVCHVFPGPSLAFPGWLIGPNQVRPKQVKPNEVRTNKVRPNQVRPN